MLCSDCGGEVVDPRLAFDAPPGSGGDAMRPMHRSCAEEAGYAVACEVCNEVFAPRKMASNERTGRVECGPCYKAWQVSREKEAGR